MKATIAFGALAIFSTLVGCAHGHTRGTVVFKDNDKEGHVCIGHDEVKVGDIVSVYKNSCQIKSVSAGGKGESGSEQRVSCNKQFIGEGKIVELSNEHFARLEAIGDLSLEQGLIVEKSK